MAVLACATPATAQSNDYNSLMALDNSGLQRELTLRYDAGLAASLDDSIISSDDPRYLWALETKVQCGIALGFMRSSTRDETSIRNCANAYARMQVVPAPPPARVTPPVQVAQPPARRPDNCDDSLVATVFFDFDMAEVTPAAAAILDTVGQQVRACGWSRLNVVGHTDQAGSDQYNMGLSRARADAVAAALRSRNMGSIGLDVGAQGENNPRVPLPDGTRSPQNRRVEISAD
ncbi:hypothetical protein AAW00_00010 [Aurantiacibacter luteus]|uniref:OmpA-like domain-containing protein n=1 Tax=Aurantiacibacter luteus TaxID=1581420 RepID=A0A0G9MZ44_9SPHN|nr:hypothetical protein AAW00_00010 [Aurantiacibacter luteus]